MASGNLVPVIGSGVSTATAGIPGWKGIIQSGFDHVATVGTYSEAELRVARELLSGTALVSAAQRMAELLGCPRGEFPLWLQNTFGVDRAKDIRSRKLIDRIIDLPSSVLVTTN